MTIGNDSTDQKRSCVEICERRRCKRKMCWKNDFGTDGNGFDSTGRKIVYSEVDVEGTGTKG